MQLLSENLVLGRNYARKLSTYSLIPVETKHKFSLFLQKQKRYVCVSLCLAFVRIHTEAAQLLILEVVPCLAIQWALVLLSGV